MSYPHDELIRELIAAFCLKRNHSFDPFSLWFSYGSNLDKSYFDKKLTERMSTLTLYGVIKATLHNYRRSLDNRSEGHGLAYAIHNRKGGRVQGIVHAVPIESLCDFLRMEGVLNKRCEVSDNPSYKVIEVKVESEEGTIPTFGLEGRKRCVGDERVQSTRDKYNLLEEYIQASVNGARDCGIKTASFLRNLAWLKSTT